MNKYKNFTNEKNARMWMLTIVTRTIEILITKRVESDFWRDNE